MEQDNARDKEQIKCYSIRKIQRGIGEVENSDLQNMNLEGATITCTEKHVKVNEV